jgi:hypothetical protein
MYTAVANGLETSNIRYYCKDPTLQNPEGLSFYPIDMTRIDGRRAINDDECKNFVQGIYYVQIEPLNKAAYAYTITSNPGSPIFEKQVKCTGSTTQWSDILLKRILDEVKNGRPATFSNWPKFIGVANWFYAIGFPLTGPIMEETVFHEIIHSVGVPDPNRMTFIFIYFLNNSDQV